MADSTVAALTAAAALTGAELFYAVQGGADRKVTAAQIRTLAASGSYNVQDYGWLPDGTNHATEALALLATVAAAGGGTIYFPPSTGTYRCDSQLFIPNDAASIPLQANIRVTGAGGGSLWGNASFAQRTASTLDLRYTAVDGNAKIESRGTGSLLIDHLTLIDGGSANATPFVHATNTTVTVRDCTFIGSGSATQDGIVFGGASDQVPSGAVTAPYQGYGSIVDSNHFRKMNRGVFARTYANSIVVTNNAFLAPVGTISLEFSCATGNPPDCITGVFVTGNTIEMSAPMVYGVVLSGCRNSYFCNSFYDVSGSYVSDYRLVKASAPAGYNAQNIFVMQWTSGGKPMTQIGDVTQLSLNTYIGANSATNPFNDGIASSFLSGGAEVQGTWRPANNAAGALNIRDQFEPTELLCLSTYNFNGSYIDAWSNGFWRPLTLQPRGGPVVVYGPLTLRPSAITLVNGLNNTLALWQPDATNKSSFLRIIGPTAAFSIGGISTTAAASNPGNLLTLYNSTSQAMTLVNENGSATAVNRIKTLTGANVVLRAGPSSATLIYDDTDQRWILTASN